MFNTLIAWFLSKEVMGPLLGVVLAVLLIEMFLPFIRKKRITAEQKLKNFYNMAYAFVKIREDFSVVIEGIMHNKENCGFFHNFNFDNLTGYSNTFNEGKQLVSITENIDKISGTIFDENKFFEYVSMNFDSIDSDLKILFINYFKARGPEMIQRKGTCNDSKLIRLRREIEAKIISGYIKYSRRQ